MRFLRQLLAAVLAGLSGIGAACADTLQLYIDGDYSISSAATEATMGRAFAASQALSADTPAALNPNWPEVHEPMNAPVLGNGPALFPFTGRGGKRGGNHAHAAFVREVTASFERAQAALYKAWNEFARMRDQKVTDRRSWEALRDSLMQIARAFDGTGNVLEGFSFAMIWGVLVGTYSSIFVASPMLLLLKLKRGSRIDAPKDAAAQTA